MCFTYLGPVCLFFVFDVFSPICFELSVPVQVIAWKDSRFQNDLLCVEWDVVKLYSLTHWHGYLNTTLVSQNMLLHLRRLLEQEFSNYVVV